MDQIKIDLGCGQNKKEGYIGIDIDKYDGVDIVQDLRFTPLPFEDQTVDTIYCAHFLEHLEFNEVIYLMNECFRILKPNRKMEAIVPHGMSYAGMVDLSHKTFWTEDTFGYFTPENIYYYSWFYELKGERFPLINKWKVISNNSTPPFRYTVDGWVEVKLREVDAILERLP